MIAVCISIFAGFEITDTPTKYCADPSYCDVHLTRSEVGIAWMFFLIGVVALILPVSQTKPVKIIGIVLTVIGATMMLLAFLEYNGFFSQPFYSKVIFSIFAAIVLAIGLFTLGVKGLGYLLHRFENLIAR